MAHFPDTPSFTGFNTPSRIEADIANLVHQGTIAPELDGAFYRVQPDPQFPPRLGDDIAFNGDGMITRFHLHRGQCDFRPFFFQYKAINNAKQRANCATRVASPAPGTPSLGKGPHPNTRNRPSSVLRPTAPMVMNMGVLESFNDRKVAVVTALMTIRGAEAEKS